MKQRLKDIITKLLWMQVRRLRAQHKPLVIGVAGAVGKTGTKTAITTVLRQQMPVAWQAGNYNALISVPLVFFKQKMPALYNPLGWLKIFIMNEAMIRGAYKYQVVVLELGADRPNDMAQFKDLLRLDYGILTAISPEHMANFESMDEVADEELTIAEMCETLLVDIDAVPKKYQKNLVEMKTYSEGAADCRMSIKELTKALHRRVVLTLRDDRFEVTTPLLAKQSVPSLAAATLLGSLLELTHEEIQKGLDAMEPVAGRMQLLRGVRGSIILDDTYNSSPKAAIAALSTLYEIPAKHKIAILGQMNEMGEFSQELHEEVGKYCDPKQLEIVITIGAEANEYLAAAAEKRGCKVMRCPSPDHAADVAQRLIQKDTVILVKGSQNAVFAEEAVKELLENPKDAKKLVRQSRSWLRTKERQFSTID